MDLSWKPGTGGIFVPRSHLEAPASASDWRVTGGCCQFCPPQQCQRRENSLLPQGWVGRQELLQCWKINQTLRDTGAWIPTSPFAISTDGPDALYNDPLQLLNWLFQGGFHLGRAKQNTSLTELEGLNILLIQKQAWVIILICTAHKASKTTPNNWQQPSDQRRLLGWCETAQAFLLNTEMINRVCPAGMCAHLHTNTPIGSVHMLQILCRISVYLYIHTNLCLYTYKLQSLFNLGSNSTQHPVRFFSPHQQSCKYSCGFFPLKVKTVTCF